MIRRSLLFLVLLSAAASRAVAGGTTIASPGSKVYPSTGAIQAPGIVIKSTATSNTPVVLGQTTGMTSGHMRIPLLRNVGFGWSAAVSYLGYIFGGSDGSQGWTIENAIGTVIHKFQIGVGSDPTSQAYEVRGIAAGGPSARNTLDSYGSFGVPTATTTVSLTLGPTHYLMLANATGGNITLTLPDLRSDFPNGVDRRFYRACKTDSGPNTVWFAAGSGDSVDGGSALSHQNECVEVLGSLLNGSQTVGTWTEIGRSLRGYTTSGVPYVGANADVDLGAFEVKATSMSVTGAGDSSTRGALDVRGPFAGGNGGAYYGHFAQSWVNTSWHYVDWLIAGSAGPLAEVEWGPGGTLLLHSPLSNAADSFFMIDFSNDIHLIFSPGENAYLSPNGNVTGPGTETLEYVWNGLNHLDRFWRFWGPIYFEDDLFMLNLPPGPLVLDSNLHVSTGTVGGGGVFYQVPDGRLTTESGVAVSSYSRTAQTTLYYTNHLASGTIVSGGHVPLYLGGSWTDETFSELSLSNGALSADTVYEILVGTTSGSPALKVLAWSDHTTMPSDLTFQDGVLVKKSDKTQRDVGTVYVDGSGNFTDSLHLRYVWNLYNQTDGAGVFTSFGNTDWSYTSTAFRPLHGDSNINISVVCGINQNAIDIAGSIRWTIGSASYTFPYGFGIGINRTDGNDAQVANGDYANGGSTTITHHAFTALTHKPKPGLTTYTFVEAEDSDSFGGVHVYAYDYDYEHGNGHGTWKY